MFIFWFDGYAFVHKSPGKLFKRSDHRLVVGMYALPASSRFTTSCSTSLLGWRLTSSEELDASREKVMESIGMTLPATQNSILNMARQVEFDTTALRARRARSSETAAFREHRIFVANSGGESRIDAVETCDEDANK
ncbi:unnamed protein product [Prorocentrum cordatum]|uniref:Uncharacterized protein n=1 Tax=Prorocentrum cordatum TaxID=2364126 RepID=A0ABN9WKV9_9DINO|nr:unnamed protein product [Polarella glacialis]